MTLFLFLTSTMCLMYLDGKFTSIWMTLKNKKCNQYSESDVCGWEVYGYLDGKFTRVYASCNTVYFLFSLQPCCL